MKAYITLSVTILLATALRTGAQTDEDISFLYIPLNEISASVETVRARGYEVNSSHPGIDNYIVAPLEAASREFIDASDCLEIDPTSESVDLRAIAKWRYDNLSQFEVCLQRIFSYLDGPQEIEIWLREVGFRVVQSSGVLSRNYWNSRDQTEGPSISAAWNDRPRWGAFYPLSRSFNWSSLIFHNLTISIAFDRDGDVFDLHAGMSFN